MNCWVMKMKHGKEGPDYSQELWDKKLVGIMYGRWKCDDYSNRDAIKGLVEKGLLECTGKCRGKKCDKHWPRQISLFFDSMQEEDLVAVSLTRNQRPILGIAQLGKLVDGQEIDCRETFKCRVLDNKREFNLNQLPPSLILLRQMPFRQAIKRLTDGNYEAISRLMQRLYEGQANIPPQPMEFGYLHDAQWEILCGEYLRAEKDFSLMLRVGGTLRDFDIMGRNGQGESIVAQCKNGSTAWPRNDTKKGVYQWEEIAASFSQKYFFSRGGFSGQVRPESSVIEITGQDIDAWLNTNRGESMRKRLPHFALPFDLSVGD